MPSAEDQDHPARLFGKKRRRANACDMCRKKKIKCNGRQLDTGKCTNCNTYNWDCTLMLDNNKKYAPGYIEALKTKIEKLEKLIERLAPDQDFTAEVGFKLTQANWMSPGVLGGPSKVVSKAVLETQSPNMFVFGRTSGTANSYSPPSSASVSSHTFSPGDPEQVSPMASLPDEEQLSDDEEADIQFKLEQLSIDSGAYTEPNHFGRASWYGVVNTSLHMCKKLRPDVDSEAFFTARGTWQRPTWFDDSDGNLFRVGQHGRLGDQPFIDFPEPALMDDLVELYFANVNILLPVLHRPTFEASKARGFHMKSRAFGGVLLLVCAIGSRFSTNCDVLLDGETTWQSAGWKWYSQATIFDAQLDIPNSQLYHLQMTCLASIYAMDMSVFHTWTFAGIGIKMAMDIGAHRRTAYSVVPTLKDEMHRRAFWVLVRLDRTSSEFLGRPCSIQEEDFDLSMPLCCDDEYLTLKDEHFAQQPDGKPSLMTYFILSLKLSQIAGLAMRTIYASTKARMHYGFKGEWLTRTIAHLDSLLEQWNGSVPDYLRYDPASAHEAFKMQALRLHMQYHELQLMLYRRFLVSFPAPIPHLPLAICLNSAHSLVRLTTILYDVHKQQTCLHTLNSGVWHAAVVLLIGLGNSRLHKVAFEHKRAMAGVDLMLGILHESQKRWRWASRFMHLIQMLKHMDAANESEVRPPRRKRSYEESIGAHTQAEPVLFSSVASIVVPDVLGGARWDAFSTFGNGGVDMPQGNGAMLGNVDFGALLGFGGSGLFEMNASAMASAPVGASAAGLAPGSFGFGMEGWDQQGIDSSTPRTSEWQWMMPHGAEYPAAEYSADDSTYPVDGGAYYPGQWRPH